MPLEQPPPVASAQPAAKTEARLFGIWASAFLALLFAWRFYQTYPLGRDSRWWFLGLSLLNALYSVLHYRVLRRQRDAGASTTPN